MFESTFVPEKSERSGTIALALILQTAAVAGLVIVPLLSVAVIDTTRAITIVSPMRNLPKPRQPDSPEPPQTQSAARSVFRVALLPSVSRAFEAPRTVMALAPGDPPVYSGGGSTGTAPGIPGGILDGGAVAVPIPKPVKPESPKIVHLTSALSQSQLVYGPKPEYPRIAMLSRTEGVVRLQAVIGTDGTIRNLRVVEGNPLLTGAALAAVQQWRYRPMVLNGETHEVMTEIDVHFKLEH